MDSGRPIELERYLPDMLSRNEELEIHVGCDSQNKGVRTIYVTTIVLRFPSRGAHVLYNKERVPVIKDMFTKLWGEVERSISLAEHLKSSLGVSVHQIDLDYNEDPVHASNRVLSAASGYVQSMGYEVKAKPDLLMAVWAANVLCS